METQKTSPKDIMIKYGVILGVITVLFNVILYAIGKHINPHWSLAILSFVISIAIIATAFSTYKKGNGGFMKLGQAIKMGLGIAVIAGILGALWNIILIEVLEPNYSEMVLESVRTQMLESNPDMPDSQVEQIVEFQKSFTTIGFIIPVGIIMSLFFGFIISLITGLIMKKENPYADV